MKRNEAFFLNFLSECLPSKEKIDITVPTLNEKEWEQLFILMDEQSLLPLFIDFIKSKNYATLIDKSRIKSLQARALYLVIRQIIQTNEFLTLILHSQEQGFDPIVLKGIICRSLYPQPYLRPSVDEDILVSPEDMATFHQFLISEGLFADAPDANLQIATEISCHEISYHKDNSPTYIEMQKTLFDPESELFGDFNLLFKGYSERTIRVQIEDVSVRTLAPTDHLLYLILHAFKHFVHSGIGIRAVCDIGLFAGHYSTQIDWKHIRKSLEKVSAFDFARALFHIIRLYLLPDAECFNFIGAEKWSTERLFEDSSAYSDWQIEDIDVEPFLDDILAGGVHGNSSLERLHSSNITLEAIAKDKKGTATEKAGQAQRSEYSSTDAGFLRAVLNSVFLPLGKMSVRYPYLKKTPFLLPVAWGQRIGGYLKERAAARQVQHQSVDFVKSKSKGGAAESIRLGKSRVELLKKYGIIQKR